MNNAPNNRDQRDLSHLRNRRKDAVIGLVVLVGLLAAWFVSADSDTRTCIAVGVGVITLLIIVTVTFIRIRRRHNHFHQKGNGER